MSTDGNEQAFDYYPGLTKREYFAVMVMQGILAGNPPDIVNEAEKQGLLTKDAVALISLEFADALIAALNTEASKDATA